MLMKRTIFLTFILVVALSTSVALGGDHNVKRVPAGAVAFHWVGNLTCCFGPYDLPELVGYIAFIEGVQGPFFRDDPLDPDDKPGVETAYFTVRLDRDTIPGFIPLPSADPGEVIASLIPPGYTWGVYYDETPDGDWADLDSFSDGERVATFEESAFLGTTILSTGMIHNLFSNRLIWSKSFWVGDQKVDFKKLVPNGVTINNVGSTNTSAFTASAVAIGGRGWR
jgi:hypothetical protein